MFTGETADTTGLPLETNHGTAADAKPATKQVECFGQQWCLDSGVGIDKDQKFRRGGSGSGIAGPGNLIDRFVHHPVGSAGFRHGGGVIA